MLYSVTIFKNMHKYMHTLETCVFELVSKVLAHLFFFYFYAKRIVTDSKLQCFKSHFTVCVGCLAAIIADLPNTRTQSSTRLQETKLN